MELDEAFWRSTGELPFDATIMGVVECYRLSIRPSRGGSHRIFRMQRPSMESASGSELIAHFVQLEQANTVSSMTHRIPLEARHWLGMAALLEVARFWELPERIDCRVLDGETFTLEAFQAGRRHQIKRQSPNPVVSGGELACVVTDYLERLGFLALYQCELHRVYG